MDGPNIGLTRSSECMVLLVKLGRLVEYPGDICSSSIDLIEGIRTSVCRASSTSSDEIQITIVDIYAIYNVCVWLYDLRSTTQLQVIVQSTSGERFRA